MKVDADDLSIFHCSSTANYVVSNADSQESSCHLEGTVNVELVPTCILTTSAVPQTCVPSLPSSDKSLAVLTKLRGAVTSSGAK